MAKVPLSELPIYTWTPDQEGQPAIARFPGLPIFAEARTPFQARKKLDDWRKAEEQKRAGERERAAERAAKKKPPAADPAPTEVADANP